MKLPLVRILTLFLSLQAAHGLNAQSSTEAKSVYDHGLRHFYWLYTYDAVGHQRRDWYQESPSTWNEIYEDGRYNHSRMVVINANVDGNSGIVVVGDTATLRLFIPDQDAHGSHPKWLRIQQPGAANWSFLAELFRLSIRSNNNRKLPFRYTAGCGAGHPFPG
jgi:hypothetical protein